MPAEITKYKDKYPVIALVYKDTRGVERRFSFGIKKAQLILENENDIKVFVQTNGGVQ